MTHDPDKTMIAPGIEVEGYTLVRLLGEGGMARVYLAQDEELDRMVAIKVIQQEMLDQPELLARFSDEGKTIASFRHPNIVSVFASGVSGSSPYIVQEYVSGGSLEDLLTKGRLAPEQAVAIATDIARALDYSHHHQIVHRDVKPANILFTEEGVSVLSDFGIAHSQTKSRHTSAGTVIGSPYYMPPEQLQGGAVTPAVDVYALGIVMFEMLTADTLPDELRRISEARDVKRVSSYLPASARWCGELIGRCLHMEPSERPTADELKVLLRNNKPTSKLPLIVTAAVLLVGLFSAALWWQSRPGVLLTQPADASVFVDGQRQTDRLTLDGQQPIVAAVVAPGHVGQLVELEASSSSRTVQLLPWQLPDKQEIQFFNELIGSLHATTDLGGVDLVNSAFDRLLQLNALVVSGDDAATNDLVQALSTLADAGDAPAQFAMFVANDEGLVDIEDALATDYLVNASQSGYGLATFYLALKNQLNEQESRGGMDRTAVREYVETMDRAAQQGLGFARERADEARALLDP